jgi:hypothetical protein
MIQKFNTIEVSTFEEIHIITAMKTEALYQQLEKDFPSSVFIKEGVESIPTLEEFEAMWLEDKKRQYLVCFDDLVLEKKQDEVKKFYMRARKFNVSVVYLSQRYFEIDMFIRSNVCYVAFLCLAEDVKRALALYCFNYDKDFVKSMYDDAISTPLQPFFVDFKKREYRKGFLSPYKIEGRQVSRPKYINKSGHKATPHDLFETTASTVAPLIEFFRKHNVNLSATVFYEPSCGNNAIVKELVKAGATNVIARDLFTTEEKHDYLAEEDPEYDILVTNPPYCLKYQFIEKAIQSLKPFALLLPLGCITTKKWYNICGTSNLHFQILSPPPDFLHAGRMVSVADIVWVYGNVNLQFNTLSYFNMSAFSQNNKEDEGGYEVTVDPQNDELAKLMEDSLGIAK